MIVQYEVQVLLITAVFLRSRQKSSESPSDSTDYYGNLVTTCVRVVLKQPWICWTLFSSICVCVCDTITTSASYLVYISVFK